MVMYFVIINSLKKLRELLYLVAFGTVGIALPLYERLRAQKMGGGGRLILITYIFGYSVRI